MGRENKEIIFDIVRGQRVLNIKYFLNIKGIWATSTKYLNISLDIKDMSATSTKYQIFL